MMVMLLLCGLSIPFHFIMPLVVCFFETLCGKQSGILAQRLFGFLGKKIKFYAHVCFGITTENPKTIISHIKRHCGEICTCFTRSCILEHSAKHLEHLSGSRLGADCTVSHLLRKDY